MHGKHASRSSRVGAPKSKSPLHKRQKKLRPSPQTTPTLNLSTSSLISPQQPATTSHPAPTPTPLFKTAKPPLFHPFTVNSRFFATKRPGPKKGSQKRPKEDRFGGMGIDLQDLFSAVDLHEHSGVPHKEYGGGYSGFSFQEKPQKGSKFIQTGRSSNKRGANARSSMTIQMSFDNDDDDDDSDYFDSNVLESMYGVDMSSSDNATFHHFSQGGASPSKSGKKHDKRKGRTDPFSGNPRDAKEFSVHFDKHGSQVFSFKEDKTRGGGKKGRKSTKQRTQIYQDSDDGEYFDPRDFVNMQDQSFDNQDPMANLFQAMFGGNAEAFGFEEAHDNRAEKKKTRQTEQDLKKKRILTTKDGVEVFHDDDVKHVTKEADFREATVMDAEIVTDRGSGSTHSTHTANFHSTQSTTQAKQARYEEMKKEQQNHPHPAHPDALNQTLDEYMSTLYSNDKYGAKSRLYESDQKFSPNYKDGDKWEDKYTDGSQYVQDVDQDQSYADHGDSSREQGTFSKFTKFDAKSAQKGTKIRRPKAGETLSDAYVMVDRPYDDGKPLDTQWREQFYNGSKQQEQQPIDQHTSTRRTTQSTTTTTTTILDDGHEDSQTVTKTVHGVSVDNFKYNGSKDNQFEQMRLQIELMNAKAQTAADMAQKLTSGTSAKSNADSAENLEKITKEDHIRSQFVKASTQSTTGSNMLDQILNQSKQAKEKELKQAEEKRKAMTIDPASIKSISMLDNDAVYAAKLEAVLNNDVDGKLNKGNSSVDAGYAARLRAMKSGQIAFNGVDSTEYNTRKSFDLDTGSVVNMTIGDAELDAKLQTKQQSYQNMTSAMEKVHGRLSSHAESIEQYNKEYQDWQANEKQKFEARLREKQAKAEANGMAVDAAAPTYDSSKYYDALSMPPEPPKQLNLQKMVRDVRHELLVENTQDPKEREVLKQFPNITKHAYNTNTDVQSQLDQRASPFHGAKTARDVANTLRHEIMTKNEINVRLLKNSLSEAYLEVKLYLKSAHKAGDISKDDYMLQRAELEDLMVQKDDLINLFVKQRQAKGSTVSYLDKSGAAVEQPINHAASTNTAPTATKSQSSPSPKSTETTAKSAQSPQPRGTLEDILRQRKSKLDLSKAKEEQMQRKLEEKLGAGAFADDRFDYHSTPHYKASHNSTQFDGKLFGDYDDRRKTRSMTGHPDELDSDYQEYLSSHDDISSLTNDVLMGQNKRSKANSNAFTNASHFDQFSSKASQRDRKEQSSRITEMYRPSRRFSTFLRANHPSSSAPTSQSPPHDFYTINVGPQDISHNSNVTAAADNQQGASQYSVLLQRVQQMQHTHHPHRHPSQLTQSPSATHFDSPFTSSSTMSRMNALPRQSQFDTNVHTRANRHFASKTKPPTGKVGALLRNDALESYAKEDVGINLDSLLASQRHREKQVREGDALTPAVSRKQAQFSRERAEANVEPLYPGMVMSGGAPVMKQSMKELAKKGNKDLKKEAQKTLEVIQRAAASSQTDKFAAEQNLAHMPEKQGRKAQERANKKNRGIDLGKKTNSYKTQQIVDPALAKAIYNQGNNKSSQQVLSGTTTAAHRHELLQETMESAQYRRTNKGNLVKKKNAGLHGLQKAIAVRRELQAMRRDYVSRLSGGYPTSYEVARTMSPNVEKQRKRIPLWMADMECDPFMLDPILSDMESEMSEPMEGTEDHSENVDQDGMSTFGTSKRAQYREESKNERRIRSILANELQGGEGLDIDVAFGPIRNFSTDPTELIIKRKIDIIPEEPEFSFEVLLTKQFIRSQIEDLFMSVVAARMNADGASGESSGVSTVSSLANPLGLTLESTDADISLLIQKVLGSDKKAHEFISQLKKHNPNSSGSDGFQDAHLHDQSASGSETDGLLHSDDVEHRSDGEADGSGVETAGEEELERALAALLQKSNSLSVDSAQVTQSFPTKSPQDTGIKSNTTKPAKAIPTNAQPSKSPKSPKSSTKVVLSDFYNPDGTQMTQKDLIEALTETKFEIQTGSKLAAQLLNVDSEDGSGAAEKGISPEHSRSKPNKLAKKAQEAKIHALKRRSVDVSEIEGDFDDIDELATESSDADQDLRASDLSSLPDSMKFSYRQKVDLFEEELKKQRVQRKVDLGVEYVSELEDDGDILDNSYLETQDKYLYGDFKLPDDESGKKSSSSNASGGVVIGEDGKKYKKKKVFDQGQIMTKLVPISANVADGNEQGSEDVDSSSEYDAVDNNNLYLPRKYHELHKKGLYVQKSARRKSSEQLEQVLRTKDEWNRDTNEFYDDLELLKQQGYTFHEDADQEATEKRLKKYHKIANQFKPGKAPVINQPKTKEKLAQQQQAKTKQGENATGDFNEDQFIDELLGSDDSEGSQHNGGLIVNAKSTYPSAKSQTKRAQVESLINQHNAGQKAQPVDDYTDSEGGFDNFSDVETDGFYDESLLFNDEDENDPSPNSHLPLHDRLQLSSITQFTTTKNRHDKKNTIVDISTIIDELSENEEFMDTEEEEYIKGSHSKAVTNEYGAPIDKRRRIAKIVGGDAFYTFELHEDDLSEHFVRGSGPGGQSVNKTKNCVVLQHIPTSTVVKCSQTRELHINRAIARKIMKRKLEALFQGKDSYLGRKIERLQRKKQKSHQRQKRGEKYTAKRDAEIARLRAKLGLDAASDGDVADADNNDDRSDDGEILIDKVGNTGEAVANEKQTSAAQAELDKVKKAITHELNPDAPAVGKQKM